MKKISTLKPGIKMRIIYQLHVRSFYDSNADGIGDFRGLTEKLDYLNSWELTPFGCYLSIPLLLRMMGMTLKSLPK